MGQSIFLYPINKEQLTMGTELNLVPMLLKKINSQAQEAKQPSSISKPISMALTRAAYQSG